MIVRAPRAARLTFLGPAVSGREMAAATRIVGKRVEVVWHSMCSRPMWIARAARALQGSRVRADTFYKKNFDSLERRIQKTEQGLCRDREETSGLTECEASEFW